MTETSPRPVGPDRDRSVRRSMVVGAAVGLVVALAALAPPFIAGNGGKWVRPENDYNAYLVAWYYYVRDAWRMPIFDIPGMGYPEGGSVLFNDALPLVALPTKVLYALSGATVNPFGWWILLTYVLQGAMAARLVRAVGVRSRLAELAAAIFAVCSNPFMSRMGHTAISSHFLLLWALSLHFESVRDDRPRTREHWALAAVAILVNSYLFAMVMLLHAATLGALWRRLRWAELRATLIGAFAVVAIALFSGYGVFLVNPSSMKAQGFGLYSWNLVGLLMPPELGLVRDGTGGQYEGEGYIGSGPLLVLIVCLLIHPAEILRQMRRYWTLTAALLLMLAYAASNRIYWGSALVLWYYLPPFVEDLGSFFRANGRFIWPVSYALMVLPTAVVFRRSRPRVAWLLVAAAVAVHIADNVPGIRSRRAQTLNATPDLINSPRLSYWMGRHDRLWQFPSWACGGLAGSARIWGNKESNRELQVELLAAKRGLPTNSVYTSRLLKDCAAELPWAADPQLEPGVLYLLGREGVAMSPALARLAASPVCQNMGWATACSQYLVTKAAAKSR